MPKIIKELQGIDYLHRIVLSLDKADKEQFLLVKRIMASLQADVRVSLARWSQYAAVAK